MISTKNSNIFRAKDYNNKWEVFNHISWNLYKPLSTAGRYDYQLDKLVSSSDIMKLRVPVKKGDRVAIIYYTPCCCSGKKGNETITVLSEPILGKPTVGNVLKTLERGLRQTIKPASRRRFGKGFTQYFDKDGKYPKDNIIYSKIANYFDTNVRISLIKRYEEGRLYPFELLGDHRYFEGMKKYGNIIKFYTGS